jgi:hypothetical protein
MERARIVLEVTAGLIPGQALPEHTKRWAITEAEWQDTANRANLLAERNGQMQGYANLLMLQPDQLNWVRTDWIYL